MTHCPTERGIGGRPENQKAPFYVGNTCEPWMARFAIIMLDQLLHTSKFSLEFLPPRSCQLHGVCRQEHWIMAGEQQEHCLQRNPAEAALL